MEQQMFCFQCEQTGGGTGCTGCAGVCGKSETAAALQDILTGALVNLAAVCPDETPSPTLSRLLLRSLFATITNVDFNPQTLQAHIDEVHALLKTYGGSPAQDFSLQEIWHAQEDIRSLKSLLLFGIPHVGPQQCGSQQLLMQGLSGLASVSVGRRIIALSHGSGKSKSYLHGHVG